MENEHGMHNQPDRPDIDPDTNTSLIHAHMSHNQGLDFNLLSGVALVRVAEMDGGLPGNNSMVLIQDVSMHGGQHAGVYGSGDG